MQEISYDAVVIGSGAAGSFAVKELTDQGLSVLLLEAGPEVTPKDFNPSRKTTGTSSVNIWERAIATLKGQPIQARAMFFSGRFGRFFVNDFKNPYTTPRGEPFLWIRGRQAGGRLHSFGRVLLRWTDDDFKGASRRNLGADWPISYDDVAPYYAEVESNLGIYGNEDGVDTLPDSVYARPAKLTPGEQAFKQEVEGRWPDRRVVSWRYYVAEPERVPRPLRTALASGRLTVRYNAVVRRITTDDATGRATGAEFVDRITGKTEAVRAASVVLCASPIESIRLMLNSASARHPTGLGNSSGTLGRYFMDQLPCIMAGTFPKVRGWAPDDSAPEDPFYGVTGGIFIPRFVARDGGTSGLFNYQGSVGRMITDNDGPARLSFFGFGPMLPHADNRVTLDPRKKDAWGIPVPHIRCVMHEEEKSMLREQQKTIVDLVREVGGEPEFVGSPLGLTEMGRGAFPDENRFNRLMFRTFFGQTMMMGASIHESGGARMGDDRSTSVLDAWNRSWDVPNLVVSDASAFASSGAVGTTLTIMALTVRACRRLAEDYKAGRL